MNLRKLVKRIVFGARGKFRYFGAQVYFPPKSGSFLTACNHGIFEAEIVRVLKTLVRPETVCFDVGANIGLMAVPVLAGCPRCRVVSFEPSPTVLSYLERTRRESPFADRWTLIPKAAGSVTGIAQFFVTPGTGGLFDGLRDTGRVAAKQAHSKVEITTIDEEWRRLGHPRVSIIKIDVEGAESDTLVGARDCLREERPDILLEWNTENLAAHQCPPEDLLAFADEFDYRIFTVPNFVRVEDADMLRLQMLGLENFILRPTKLAGRDPFVSTRWNVSRNRM